MLIKHCNTCNKDKDISQFYIVKSGKDGYTSQCKDCIRARQQKYNESHREQQKERDRRYRLNNIDKVREYETSPERKAYLKRYREEHKNKEYSKQYYQNHKEEILKRQKEYYYNRGGRDVKRLYQINNKDKISEYQKQYNLLNKDKIKANDRKRHEENKISRSMSNMVWCFCNGLKCKRHWEDLVPYNSDILK